MRWNLVPLWMHIRALLLAMFLAFGQNAAAQGRQTSIPSALNEFDPDAMRMHIMRSQEPGCEPSCPEWISLQGNFKEGNARDFRRLLDKAGKRKLPVFIHSASGRLGPAMEIGRLIRKRGLDVVVAKTSIVRCTASDAECRRMLTIGVEPGKVEAWPVSVQRAICSTACAMVLAGGNQRHVGMNTLVGFTAITSIRTERQVRREYRVTRTGGGFFTPPEVKKKLVSEEVVSEKQTTRPAADKDFASFAKYFKEMGMSEGLVAYIRQATDGKPVVLTQPQLLEARLATGTLTGAQYLRPAPPPAAAPSVSTPAAPAAPAAPVMVTPDGTRIGPAPAAPLAGATVSPAPGSVPAAAATTAFPSPGNVPAPAAGGAVPPPLPAAAAPGPVAAPAATEAAPAPAPAAGEQPKPQPAAAKPKPQPKPKPAARPSGESGVGSIFQ